MDEAETVGIRLDRVDAEGTGHIERRAVLDGDPAYREQLNRQELETVQGIRDNVSDLGDIRGGSGGTAGLANESAESIARSFESNRVVDDANVTSAYERLANDIGGNHRVEVPNLRATLQKQVDELLDMGETGPAGGLKRLMDRLAPKAPESKLVDSRPWDSGGSANAAPTGTADLSIDEIIQLRKSATNLYSNTNPNANRVLEDFKHELDDVIANVGGKHGQLFVDATAVARENFQKYKKGSIAEQATRRTPDGNLVTTPKKQMDKLWASNDVEQLRSRKAQMSDEQLVELNRSANSKLMETLDSAFDGVNLNRDKFIKSVDSWTPEFKVEMFGEDGAEQLAKVTRALQLQSTGKKVAGQTISPPDKNWMTKVLDLLGNAGGNKLGTTKVGLNVAKDGLSTVSNRSSKRMLADDLRRLNEGNLPAGALAEIQERKIKELLDANPALSSNIEFVQRMVQRWAASFGGDVTNSDRKTKLLSAKSKL